LKWDSVTWRAALYYFHWLAVAAPYFIAKAYVSAARKDKEVPALLGEKVWSYIACFFIVGVFSLMTGDTLGTHTEGGDVDEPGEVVVDWKPTDVQRHEHELKIIMVALPAAFLGLQAGYAKDRRLTPAECLELRREMDRNSNYPDY
jgi:hypothetical protein